MTLREIAQEIKTPLLRRLKDLNKEHLTYYGIAPIAIQLGLMNKDPTIRQGR